MGSHQSARAISTVWLTPPHVIDGLGGWESFDLDPCAAPAPQPWRTARHMNTEAMGDGLSLDWDGRVWCNMPYDDVEAWLDKLARHGNGVALTFARTETEVFHRHIWQRAHGLLFLEGRLFFHHPDGTRAKHNGGAPSVLCAYGAEELDKLAAANLPGQLVPLRFARFAVVDMIDQSWAQLVREWIADQPGPVSVSDAYRHFAGHYKARRNRNWQAKVRQKLRLVARRVERDRYVSAVA